MLADVFKHDASPRARSHGWARRLSIGLASVLIGGAALSAQVVDAAPSTPPAPGINGHHGPHIMPFGLTPSPVHGIGDGPTLKLPGGVAGLGAPEIAPSGAHLVYNGGRVVNNVLVVQVIWGSGSYLPQTTSNASPSLATFFQAVASSNYMDWLDSEYNTINSSFNGTKTNQHIGRGGFQQQVTITPSAAANGSVVDDSAIQAEMTAQINAGHLPAPASDASGNPSTLYALFFRHGQTITQGGSQSLVPGGFCAYHGTVAASGSLGEYYYSVLPDLVGVTGCGVGTDFQNTTSVQSHELVETLTDAEVGLATNAAGPPLAWYDSTNGEIGDICNAQQGTFGPVNGQTYTLQYEFSNAQNNCILPAYQAQNSNFSIATSPASVSVTAGSGASSTVTTSITSGSAQTVSLSVSGAPAGVTASLSPSSVTSGGSATLSISTNTNTVTGGYVLTVTGTAGTVSHSATVNLTVNSATGNDFSVTPSPASVSIAAGANGSTTINTATTSGSAQTVGLSVSGAPTGVTAFLSPTSVSSGQSSTLSITTTSNAAAGTYSLTVTGTGSSATHSASVILNVSGGTGGGGISNGGFETGNLGGWTASGASESVVSSGCHGGTFCAQLGSSSPTNGDSTIAQTFVAPSGATGISLWYKETCPDTVTYDWALATLADNTAGTTATLLSKICTTNSWTNLTSSVTAGHSYTLTLTSHDDNYGADPTFTLFDDVALTSAAPPAAGITNGGFEAGFTGWTSSGASATVVSSGCHGGAFCARLGSTNPTNGDSNLVQTFAVPSGKSQLSLWYKMACPDTVTYDWATVTLKNNATNATTTVLAKVCTTNSWTNITASVAAGTSYTLTLTSHDDNYSADPTFTLYDDVTLN